MKFHLIFLLNDDSVVTREYDIPAHGSVAKKLLDIPKEDAVAKILPQVTKAVRILDHEVFVDNRERIMWLMGCSAVQPTDPLKDHASKAA